jgi:hypothetical protein
MVIPYPKLMYQGVHVPPGVPPSENPGFKYVRVENPDAQAALGEGWFESPAEATKAFAATQGQRDRTEIEALQARIKELEALQAAGAPASGSSASPVAVPAQTAHGGTSGEPAEPAKQIGDWPSEKGKPSETKPSEKGTKK